MDFLMGVLSNIFKVDELLNNWNRNGKINDDIIFESDIKYSDREDLDVLYDEKVKGKYPVIINIHGGGWLVGDKKWRRGISTMYAENGYFVINPNYSLSPEYKYPECIRDIFKLDKWIEDNAEKYRLNLDEIYMTGDSAGGHIAAVVAAIENNKEVLTRLGIEEPKHKITKVALFCGVYDYDKCVHQAGAHGMVTEMTGCDIKDYKDTFEFYNELSPLNLVDKNFPKTYMVSAPLDIFCGGQAEELETKLRELGVPCRHYIPADRLATHCFHLNLTREDSIEAINGAIDFFNEGSDRHRTKSVKPSSALSSSCYYLFDDGHGDAYKDLEELKHGDYKEY